MKICHLCLNGPYTEGFSYQENLLPKYHVRLGYEVYQIVTPFTWQGNRIANIGEEKYTNDFGVHIIRCLPKKNILGKRFYTYPNALIELNKIKPDILFIHDVQFLDATKVADYLNENPNCLSFADNHCDYSNSAKNWLSKHILHKIIWRHCAKALLPYINRFYGVLPARVDLLTELYGIPKEKCALLVMGADDDEVKRSSNIKNIIKTRKKFGFTSDDFVIVTGGKIDKWKTETLSLMEAYKDIALPNLKLLVFGAVDSSMKERFNELLKNSKIVYVPWASFEESFDLFSMSDLVVFPGRHSVYWEQVVGQGKPMICKLWDGTKHIDIGGNVAFLKDSSVKEIKDLLLKLVNDPEEYKKMLEAASSEKRLDFLYSKIASNSISTK